MKKPADWRVSSKASRGLLRARPPLSTKVVVELQHWPFEQAGIETGQAGNRTC